MPPPNTPQPEFHLQDLAESDLPPTPRDAESGRLPPSSCNSGSPLTTLRHNFIDLRGLDYPTPVDENLLCPVCREPLIDPVTTPCDHVFCRECFDQSYERSRVCPIDRNTINNNELGPTHRLILNQLDALEVRCPNTSSGCTKVLARSMVRNHVFKYCPYEMTDCPDPECKKDVPRKDADQPCLHKLTLCPDCGEESMMLALDFHRMNDCLQRDTHCTSCEAHHLRVRIDEHDLVCPEIVAPCKWASYGCSHTSKRKELPQHDGVCHFRIFGPVVDDLKSEIKHLRGEVQFLNERDKIKDRRIRFLECDKSTYNEGIPMDLSLPVGSPSAEVGPYESRDQYLLQLLEHHEGKVDVLSGQLTELEAKQTMMLFNETIPIKEQLAELRSSQGTLNMHVRWLMNFRLQENRPRPQNSSTDQRSSAGAGSGGGVGVTQLPPRRLSDTTRENITKL